MKEVKTVKSEVLCLLSYAGDIEDRARSLISDIEKWEDGEKMSSKELEKCIRNFSSSMDIWGADIIAINRYLKGDTDEFHKAIIRRDEK